jgi:hypothetical protein
MRCDEFRAPTRAERAGNGAAATSRGQRGGQPTGDALTPSAAVGSPGRRRPQSRVVLSASQHDRRAVDAPRSSFQRRRWSRWVTTQSCAGGASL